MKDTLTPKLLDLMRKFEQQSIGFSTMMGEAEKPVPPKKPLPKPEPKKADPKAEKPDFKKEKNPSTKDPKKPEPEAPAPEPREIDMKDIPKTEATKAEKQAYRQERLTRLKDNQNILRTGVCPRCGTKLVRNNSMTGWWQCGHVGSPGFQAVPGPSCDFQFFYDPSPEEAAALREATTLNPEFTQQQKGGVDGGSYGMIPEEEDVDNLTKRLTKTEAAGAQCACTGDRTTGTMDRERECFHPGQCYQTVTSGEFFCDKCLKFWEDAVAAKPETFRESKRIREFMDFGGITHILKNPTGTFSPVGSVPLAMMRQSTPTSDDIMGGRVQNGVAYNTKGFPSVEDFLAAAASSGTKLCDKPGCACRKYF